MSTKERYSSRDDMSGHKPKLLQSIEIYNDYETGNTLNWLAEFYKNKKEKEEKLVKLFSAINMPSSLST